MQKSKLPSPTITHVTNHYSLLLRDSPASNPITYPTGLACTTVLRRSMKKFPTRLKAALLCPMEGINATFSKEKTWRKRVTPEVGYNIVQSLPQ